jgi:hypothetical protein
LSCSVFVTMPGDQGMSYPCRYCPRKLQVTWMSQTSSEIQ